jgi:UDP-N-acetylmuramoyl-L-alanyl-D-glutamate--2,6-diaminopimelate ligase
VTNATERSDQCVPKALFAAIPGTQHDGAQFASDAIERGAGCLLVQRPLAGVTVPQCVVSNVRKAYAELCSALDGHPSRQLSVSAVTGTNGKTTVTWLIRSILQAAGKRTGCLGTVEYHDGVQATPAGLTTPDSKSLSNWLAAMVAQRTTHAVIELSSHALHQDRSAGTLLDAAVVTNVTQDHFDYHSDYEAYLSCKARIFEHCKQGGCVVLNADDPGSDSLRMRADETLNVVAYGLESPADVTAEIVQESLLDSRFVLNLHGERIEVQTSLAGRHNVSNCLAAAAVAAHCGASLETIRAGIERLVSIPGRLERVDCGQSFNVFVDYAHTADALGRCVGFLRKMALGRVICVFGAGGDRDRLKRPLLGRAASEADLAVITSDNPRSENPDAIIDDILPGFHTSSHEPYVEADRAEAIRWALEQAEPGDCVLVAGKGHEVEQIINADRIPFDDREVIRKVLVDFAHPQHVQRARMSA